MLKFEPISLKDKPWIDDIVFSEGSRSADFNFGNLYMWDGRYKQLVCRCGSRMITKIRYEGVPAFAFPIGSGDLSGPICALKEFADHRGYPLVIYGIEEANKALLEQLFPGRFRFTLQESTFDYLYLAEKLSSYAGKSLHGKKNHCNFFESSFPGWQFLPIDRSGIPRCMDMLSIWQEDNAARLDSSIRYEHDAITRAFAAYESLGLDGGMLIHGGKVLGFSIGERCCRDCFDVHFEKADISIRGAYPMVCREMTRMISAKYPEVKYINREDDLGLESLRASKLSYKPEYLLQKYTARWTDD